MRTLYFCTVVSIFFFFFYLFFLTLSQPSESGCLPYFHCGLSANLGCRSEMCCARLTENTGCKNRHLCTIAQLCRAIYSQLRHVLTIGKKLVKQQYLLQMSAQYGEHRPTSGWDRSGSLCTPANLMVALWNRADHIYFHAVVCSFFLVFLFLA